ncbi:MAG TPA: succinyl-diaminopimelate desuccinylase [Magnetospirillaceae bacterium]|jgi:succinyl-diaminopimelate desuccinylase
MAFTDPLPLAQALIRKPSVTPADAGAMGVLEEALTKLGFTCTRLTFGADANRPPIENLYARLGKTGRNFCFAGHTDVVPVGQGWTTEPFGAQVRDDQLWGRGAVDMKGAIACFVAAVARVQAEGKLTDSVSLLITGDEEGRALDGTKRVLEALAAKGEKIDLCVVGEPTNVSAVGDMVKIGRRGSLVGRLRVFGTQGHSAYPHLADNPIPRIMDMLRAITAEPLDHGNAHFQPSTIAITTIDVGNTASNVIPAEARARFNIRFNDSHTGKKLEERLRKTLAAVGGEHELEVEVSGESFLTAPGPLTAALTAAITAETGKTPELSTTGGTSDARFIKNYCPVAEFGLVSRTMHKTDERVALNDLETLTRIYARLLTALPTG